MRARARSLYMYVPVNVSAAPQVQEPKSGTWYASWADAEADVSKHSYKIDPTMFPPLEDQGSERAPLHLERAMRFLPHHQDTGGFFVAVLEKVAECERIDEPSVSHRKRKAGKVRRVRPVPASHDVLVDYLC